MMNYKVAQEILMSHADSLRQGYDVTESMSLRYPELSPLFQLAQQVKGVLKVVPVSAEFAAELQTELMDTPIKIIETPADETPQQTGVIIGVAALASAATGVAVWAITRLINQNDPAPLAVAE